MEENHTPTGIRTVTLADLVEELVADAEETAAAREAGHPRGPVTGLPSVDAALGGFLAPGVHLLQAAPGAGKTALCLQTATDCGFPVLYVTAEMPPLELLRRVISRTTNTFLGKLRSGELPPAEVRALALAAARRAPMVAIMDATLGFASPREHILPVGEALRERFRTRTLLVVIDALQVWARGAGVGETEYERVNAGLEAARGLAARLGGPVLCVSHRNRPGQKAGGLHAGKGSGDLEYAAESLIEITPGEALFDHPHLREVTLSLPKNRHGEAGIEIPLEFEGRRQAFIEMSAPAPPPGALVGAPLRNGNGH